MKTIDLEKYEIISARDAHLYSNDITEEELQMAASLQQKMLKYDWFIPPYLFYPISILVLLGFMIYQDIHRPLFIFLFFLIMADSLFRFIRRYLRFHRLRKARQEYHVFSGKFLTDSVKISIVPFGTSDIHWYDHYLIAEVAERKAVEGIFCRKEIAESLQSGDRLLMMYYTDGSIFVIKKREL